MINDVYIRFILILFWNATAVKCAFGSALIAGTVWAFLFKPVRRHYVRRAAASHPFAFATPVEAIFEDAPPRRRGHRNNHSHPNNNPNNNSHPNNINTNNKDRDRDSNDHHSRYSHPTKNQMDDPTNPNDTPRVSFWCRPLLPSSAFAAAATTEEALPALLRSDAFGRWYHTHRQTLQQRAGWRQRQSQWAALANLSLLLVGAVGLPLCGFASGEDTLFQLMRRVWGERGFLEGGLVLVAGMTLGTSAVMPVGVWANASVALVALLVLLAEVALLRRLELGAGFLTLLGVTAWRVAKAAQW